MEKFLIVLACVAALFAVLLLVFVFSRMVREHRRLIQTAEAQSSAATSTAIAVGVETVRSELSRSLRRELAQFPHLLNEQMQRDLIELRKAREADGWVLIGVILHGFGGRADHLLVEMHVRTHKLRPAPEHLRQIKGSGYRFEGVPEAVLGAPPWQKVDEKNLVLLGVLYTWG